MFVQNQKSSKKCIVWHFETKRSIRKVLSIFYQEIIETEIAATTAKNALHTVPLGNAPLILGICNPVEVGWMGDQVLVGAQVDEATVLV